MLMLDSCGGQTVNMYKGGRPFNPVWQHFNLITEGAKKSAQCKICLKMQSARPEHMKAHHTVV